MAVASWRDTLPPPTVTRIWSPQQIEIYGWFESTRQPGDKDYNAVARARAGTGKTTTLVEGVNRIPKSESRILMCAYNKRIAEELVIRVTNPNVTVKTLHAVGFAAVRRYWEGVGCEFGRRRADNLTDQVCGQLVPDGIKRLISKLHTLGREMCPHETDPGVLADIAVTFELEPDEYEWGDTGFDLQFVEAKALEAMELAAAVKPQVIDGSDMIFLPLRNGWLHKAYDRVLVDEGQDMSMAQLEIAQRVCKGRMFICGDDRQAIYGFRGADSSSIDRLKRELRAVEYPLNVTYRCGKAIVALAQQIVPDFTAAPDTHEGKVSRLAEFKLTATAGPGDFILSRLNAPLVSVAMSLLRSGKRTRIAGRDIGAGLTALVRKLKGRSIPDLLKKINAWRDREIDRLLAMDREDRVEAIVDKAEMIIGLCDGAESVDDLIDWVEALFTDDGLGQQGIITCSSVHRAKGLEADRVFVLQETLRDHTVEEMNIRYVAITRAKKELVWVN